LIKLTTDSTIWHL